MDLAALAQEGAAAIAAAMATDMWGQVKTDLRRLFSGEASQDMEIDAELDSLRASLAEKSGTSTLTEVEAELRGLLKAKLRSEPDFARAFAVLIAEVSEQLGQAPAEQALHISQSAHVTGKGSSYQAGRDIHQNGR
jgi:hypothetical protein